MLISMETGDKSDQFSILYVCTQTLFIQPMSTDYRTLTVLRILSGKADVTCM